MTDELIPAQPQRLMPALWQDAHYAMIVDEVQRTFPDAIPPNAPEALHDGAAGELVIPHFQLAGEPYQVIFYFVRDRLCQVTLAYRDKASVAVAEALLPLLRARYGPEISYSPPEESQLIRMLNADWMTGTGVNVGLVCIENVALNVVYQLRMAMEASKL